MSNVTIRHHIQVLGIKCFKTDITIVICFNFLIGAIGKFYSWKLSQSKRIDNNTNLPKCIDTSKFSIDKIGKSRSSNEDFFLWLSKYA